jgi:hypothetical protein
MGSRIVDMCISGAIAAVIGLAMTFLLSFVLPFPWSLGQTLVTVGISSFAGSAVSFWRGTLGDGEQ